MSPYKNWEIVKKHLQIPGKYLRIDVAENGEVDLTVFHEGWHGTTMQNQIVAAIDLDDAIEILAGELSDKGA